MEEESYPSSGVLRETEFRDLLDEESGDETPVDDLDLLDTDKDEAYPITPEKANLIYEQCGEILPPSKPGKFIN